jgi:hypothetical protein
MGLGETGVAGPMGLQGAQGVTGPMGLGETGVAGPMGLQGEQGLTGSMGLGETGAAGPMGLQGEQGLTGIVGMMGNTGIGVQGVTGPFGGPVGDQGVTGLRGLSGTGETANVSCAISGPFPSTTITLSLTRTEISSGKSIVVCRSSGYIGVGNNALEEILIDATDIPTRFRPSEARYHAGIITAQGTGKYNGYFIYSNNPYWRLYKEIAVKFQGNGIDVGWFAFDICWEGQ